MTVLVPVFHGKPRKAPPYPKRAAIPLKPRSSDQRYIVLGRLELLSCCYAACGCDSSNIYSTRGKCSSCQQLKWASRYLSRKMLRISFKEKIPTLSARGSYSAVLVKPPNSEIVAITGEQNAAIVHQHKWRGHHPLAPGATILLQEPDGEGELHFQVLEHPTNHPEMCVCILPWGHDLPQRRVALLSNQLQDRGVKVTDDHLQATHLVISRQLKDLETLANHLRCEESDLRSHLDEKRVQCVKPSWLVKCPNKPKSVDFWSGYVSRSLHNRAGPVHQICQRDHSNVVKRVTSTYTKRNNQWIAEVFVTLSKAYEKAPLFPEEQWKALQFHRLAGRLQCLDFEVSGTRDDFAKLKRIPGIGGSTLSMIQEILATGTLSRLQEFKTNPDRVAIRNLSGIHGIGKVTVSTDVPGELSTLPSS